MEISVIIQAIRQYAEGRKHLKIQSNIIDRVAELVESKLFRGEFVKGRIEITAGEVGKSMGLANRLPAIVGALGRIATELEGCSIRGKNSKTTLLVNFDEVPEKPKPTDRVRIVHRFAGRTPGRVRILVLGLFAPLSEIEYDDFYARLNASGEFTTALYPALRLLSTNAAVRELPNELLPSLLQKEFAIGCMDVVESVEMPQSMLPAFRSQGFSALQSEHLTLSLDKISAWLESPDARDLQYIVASWGRGAMLPSGVRDALMAWAKEVRANHPGVVLDLFGLPGFARPQMSLQEFSDLLNAKFNFMPQAIVEPEPRQVLATFPVKLRKTYLRQGFLNIPAAHRELFPVDGETFGYQVEVNGETMEWGGSANLRANVNHVARLMLSVRFGQFLTERGVEENAVANVEVERSAGGEARVRIVVG